MKIQMSNLKHKIPKEVNFIRKFWSFKVESQTIDLFLRALILIRAF